MKYLLSLFLLSLSSVSIKAKEMSACDQDCFRQKYQCNIDKSFTYNTCSEELFTCRASCKSGNPQNSYSEATLPLEVAFYPTLQR